MSKENENIKVTPELRFPEFEKDGEWVKIKLIEVRDKKMKWSFIGGPFGSNLKSSDYVDAENGIRVIQLQNIGDGEFINDYKIFTSEEKANELLSNNIYPGNIILSKMGDPVGRACIIPDYHNRYVMCSDGIRLVVDEKKYDKYFIYSLINSNTFRNIVERTATGSTRKRIGLDHLKKLPLIVPKEKNEQQKIAACLNSLDDLIQAQSEKLDALKDHKKGLLQQLFPGEGERVPKLRFPEFEGDGEWVLENIESITSVITDYVANGSFKSLRENVEVTDSGGYAYYVRLVDLRAGLGHPQQKFVNKSSYNFLKKSSLLGGELLIANIGANVGEVWQMPFINVPATLAPNMIMAKFTDEIDNRFVYYFLDSEVGQKNISIAISGSGHPKINKTDFKQVKVTLPINPNEQQKIANCLTSLDDLIQTQAKKIDVLKDHKKGLMQQLFPNLNEQP